MLKEVALKNHKLEIVKIIKSGPISEISICNFNDIKSIIRIDYPSANKIKVDRENEIFILEHLRFLKNTPEILFSDLSNGILVWRYIEGSEFLLEGRHKKNSIEILGKELNKIHSVDLPESRRKYFRDSINFYRKTLQEFSSNKILARGFKLYDELFKSDDLVFCHNDLNKTNLLWSNKLILLDWEYSSFNSPYFDIASISNTYNLSINERVIMLDSYNKKGKSLLFNNGILEKWMIFSHYLDYIWAASLVSHGKIDSKGINLQNLEKKLKNII